MKCFTWRVGEAENTLPASYHLLLKSRTVPGASISRESALPGEIAARCRAHACPPREGEQEHGGAGAGSGSAAVYLLSPSSRSLMWSSSLSPSCSTKEA